MFQHLTTDPTILYRWQTPGGILSLDTFPDGRIITGCIDKTIKLWRPGTDTCLTVLTGHSRPVTAIAVFNTWLASGSFDKTIKLWDERGICQATWASTTSWQHGHVFVPLPDAGEAYLVTTNDCIINFFKLVFDRPNDKPEIFNLAGHSKFVSTLLALPNEQLASGSSDNTIKIWDLKNRVCLTTLIGHTEVIVGLVQLPGNRLASASYDRTIRIWDWQLGQCLATLPGHSNWVMALAMLHNNRLASGSRDGTIQIWNMDNMMREQVIYVGLPVNALATLPTTGDLVNIHSNIITVWNINGLLQQNHPTHLEQQARQGVGYAQKRMAKYFIKNKHLLPCDHEQKKNFNQQAFYWYQQASMNESREVQIDAKMKMGSYYEQGKGVKRNIQQAIDSYYQVMTLEKSYLFKAVENSSRYNEVRFLSREQRYAYLGPQMWEDSAQYLFTVNPRRAIRDLSAHEQGMLKFELKAWERRFYYERNLAFWVDYFVNYLVPLQITQLVLPQNIELQAWYVLDYLKRKNATLPHLSITQPSVMVATTPYDQARTETSIEAFFSTKLWEQF